MSARDLDTLTHAGNNKPLQRRHHDEPRAVARADVIASARPRDGGPSPGAPLVAHNIGDWPGPGMSLRLEAGESVCAIPAAPSIASDESLPSSLVGSRIAGAP
jgi:hypothetical protein